MIALIGQIFRIIFFFLGLWKETDKAKAEEKAEVAKGVVDVFKEVDKDVRASRLNSVVGRINRMR